MARKGVKSSVGSPQDNLKGWFHAAQKRRGERWFNPSEGQIFRSHSRERRNDVDRGCDLQWISNCTMVPIRQNLPWTGAWVVIKRHGRYATVVLEFIRTITKPKDSG